MEPIRSQLIGIPRHVEEISKIVGSVVASNFRTDVLHADAQEVDVGDINITAYYDPDLDSMDRPCIELYMVYNTLDTILLFDDELFDNLTKRLCDTLSHEQIHQQQHRARFWESWEYDVDDVEEYLGNKDEIDAYSHNIANELLDYADYQKVLTLLNSPSTITIEQSVNLWVYIRTFGIDHPVSKRLLKKVIRKLPLVIQER
jgi:lysyl-tRNA synthetase class II